MPRYIDPVPQYFNANGNLVANGELHFFDSGSANYKPIWVDAGYVTRSANPVTLYGDGRAPSVFLKGAYRVVLKDENGNQIWERDPVSSNLDAPFGADWASSTVYQISDVVKEDEKYWRGLSTNNIGQRPSTDGGANWLEVSFIAGALGTLAFENTAPVSMGGTGGVTAEAARTGLEFDAIGIFKTTAPQVITVSDKNKGVASYSADSTSSGIPLAENGTVFVHNGDGNNGAAWHYIPFASPTRMYTKTRDSLGENNWRPHAFADGEDQVPTYSGALRRMAWVPPFSNPSSGASLTAVHLNSAISITGGSYTITTVGNVGNWVKIYNDTASSQSITQGAGATLRTLNGGALLTGTRTLAAYSWAEIRMNESFQWVMTGVGIT